MPVEASATARGGVTFSGASVGVPAVVMRDVPAERRFAILGDALARARGGKVTAEKDIKQRGVPGKELEIELERGVARVQIYTVGGFVLFAAVEGSRDQVRSQDADAFFASFRLSDRAKEAFDMIGR